MMHTEQKKEYCKFRKTGIDIDCASLSSYYLDDFVGIGNCVSITAVNTSPHPINSFVERISCNTTQPAKVANTDSKLMIRDATVGARCF